MRVSHLVITVAIVAIFAVPLLVFAGIIGGFWFITKENMDKGVAAVKGYTGAKDPAQAMDKFREAIHNRDYKSASYYCTKNYAEMLKKSHDNASELGSTIDNIASIALAATRRAVWCCPRSALRSGRWSCGR